jgi:hypothetical protein
VEIKIGVQYSARELVVESDESAEAVQKQVADAIAAGSLLSLTDRKGKHVFVAADKITYVEIGAGSDRKVGFLN